MTEVLIDYAPRSYFVPYHERSQRFACIVAHRRAGKTTACIHHQQRKLTMINHPRPRLAYIAPLLKQAKTVAWDILKAAAVPLLKHGAAINESELRVDYPNGGQIRLYGADNPDSLRGIYLDDAVIDEPAQIPPQLFPEVIRPALADRQGSATYIGTPKGRDAFFDQWVKALKDPVEWFTLRLPASRTCAPGVKRPPLTAEELERARRDMSPSQYAREFECSFDEPDVAQFIESAIVDAAKARIGVGGGPKLLGVDPARFGDDRTVVVLRDGDKVLSEDIHIWRGIDLMQTAARVAEIINLARPQATFIDGVGVGGGVVDRLRQMGFPVIDVSAGGKPANEARFVNLRAEMWSKMREWLKERGCIPDRDDVAADLVTPLYEFDVSNRLKIEKKEDMKKRGRPSPDIADALAMTFARPVPVETKGLAAIWQSQAAPIDSPFADL